MSNPTVTVAPPQRKPRKGGIASAAEFRTNERLGVAYGLQYDPDVCGLTVGSVQLCYGPAVNTGTNEVQTVTITGAPTGGSFQLTFSGQQTAAIAYNATAATVQAELEALSNINVGDILVGGGPGPGTPYTVAFVGGNWVAENVTQMTASHTFTGGTTPAIAVTTTTPGVAPVPKAMSPLGAGTSVVPNFGGYTGVECFISPDSDDDYPARARRALELGQDRLIESVLWGWITGGTAVVGTTLTKTIAAADEAADAAYIGLPILHLSREDADQALAAGVLVFVDGVLQTASGTPVVASSAYASGVVGVTGGITIEQSSIRVSPGRDITHNTALAIAERIYGIIVDCSYRAEYTFTP